MWNDWTLSALSRVRREAGGKDAAVSAYYLSDLITCHLQVKFNSAYAEQWPYVLYNKLLKQETPVMQ